MDNQLSEEPSCRRHETLIAPGNAWGLMVVYVMILLYKKNGEARRSGAPHRIKTNIYFSHFTPGVALG